MSKLINVIVIGFIIISTAINLYFIYNLDRFVNERLEVLDIEPEIIFLDSIEYDTVYTEKKEIVKLPIVDTLVLTDTVVKFAVDSVFVEIPIEYKHFSDTLVQTAISFDLRGFQCEVNNLYVENFLNVPTQENKPKRIGLGLQLGMGATKEGFSPYIGFGISYNLFNF
jgi:multisubunit Na+/H+ antiporter MnhC subunit